jgi:hypothetical protein
VHWRLLTARPLANRASALGRARPDLARTYAKYLTLLLTCVTSSTKVNLPKFGLAKRDFALQH